MTTSANPIRYNLANLARFSGRDPRVRFWPYVALVVVVLFMLLPMVMASLMVGAMSRLFDAGGGTPDFQVTRDEMMGLFRLVFAVSAATGAVTIILLAAAVTRRLHDTRRSGWWGLTPMPFVAFSMTAFPIMFESFGAADEPDLTLFFATFASNALYMAALVLLVVLLALPGAKGPNRYGDDPLA